MRLRTLASVTAFVVAGAVAPHPAVAFYGDGASIVSADFQRLEQGDDASSLPAVSGDGRYVAFQTRARNFFADDDPDPAGKYRVGGVFRRDMQTGAQERVADGDTFNESDNAVVFRGARAPSISADGRYVVFSTAQRLVAADVNANIDVYLRDMTRAPVAPGAYALVSAKDGSEVSATYASGSPTDGGSPVGTTVWPGAALSANGRKVAFATSAVASDLPNRAGTTTGQFNLFVRDLDAKSTTLVSRDQATGDAVGGAISAVSMSGDGTTVAWGGQSASRQTRFLNGEVSDSSALYYLWRRVADGPSAPTRRVTGEADPDDPSCPSDGSIDSDGTHRGPCFGPLTTREEGIGGLFGQLPALSSDGYTVGFLTAAGPRPNIQTGSGLDAWVTDMHPGVSRKVGSRELTREGAAGDPPANGPLSAIAISSDGRRIAVAAGRSKFVLGSPRPTGTFRAFSDARDIYLIDLSADTLERVTRGSSGADTDGDSSSPNLSLDGSTVAFASTAGNLFFGDANERTDVFVARRQPEPGGGGPSDEPPPSAIAEGTGGQVDLGSGEEPFLRVSPKRLKDGRVILVVNVPAAGLLEAVARTKVTVKKGRKRRSVEREVARARQRPGRAGRASIVLVPSRRYRSGVRSRRGLSATVKVQFKPLRGRSLSASVRVVFAVAKAGTR